MVSSSAGSSISAAAARTMLVKVRPSPVWAITPMTMPAVAQASATITELMAPASSPSMSRPMVNSFRVVLRISTTGTTDRMPISRRIGGGEAGHQRADDDDERQEQVPALPQHLAHARQVGLRQALETLLAGLEVNGEEDREIVRAVRAAARRLATVRYLTAEELGHDEGGRAHDRRHDLPAGRGHRLDGTGERRRIADPLHQRDREGAGGHHVGHGRTRDRAEQPAGHDRDLGRPAGLVAGERQGEIHEELAQCPSARPARRR